MSNDDNSQNIILTLNEFKNLDLSSIFVTVKKWKSKSFLTVTYKIELYINSSIKDKSFEVYSEKTYDDFEILYEILVDKFKNISLPEFPPKIQIFNKEETRAKYFDSLLNKLLSLAKNNPESSRTFLSILYQFVIDSTLKEKPKNIDIITPLNQENLNQFLVKEEEAIIKKPTIEKRSSITSNNSLNDENPTIFENSLLLTREKDKKTYYDWNDILIRINKEQTFKGYIKIYEQCLFIYRSITVSSYLMVIPLYKINFDIVREDYINHKTKFIESKEIFEVFKQVDNTVLSSLVLGDMNNELTIKLYHPYDNFELFFKFSRKKKLISCKNFLEILEYNSFNPLNSIFFISQIEESNLNIYGKLCIELSSLSINEYSGQCFVKVTLNPYSFDSKIMINNSTFPIEQNIHLPIHNRFGTLKFEVFSMVNEGLLVKTNSQEKMFEYNLELPEILNNYFFPTKLIELELERVNVKEKTSSIKTGKLIVGIKNYSNLLALTTKNRNKKVLEDMFLGENDDDTLSIKNLMKRMKKIIIFYRDFNHYYKTLFRFKYPVYSGILMIISIIFSLNFDAKYLLSHTILLFMIILFCYSRLYSVYLSNLINMYIFSMKNPYDFDSKFVSTKKEEEQKEVKNPNYLIEKENSGLISNIIDPIKHYKEYKETYFSVLFTLTNWVSTCEKIKNLFLWTDPLLSFYFMIFMIGIYLFIYHLEIRYILLFSFVKKFISGFFYYKFKHSNNLEIGRIIIEQSLTEWRAISKSKFETGNSGFASIKVYDGKFKDLLKENFEKHSNLVIKKEFFNAIETLGDIHNEIGKCQDMAKINKDSSLFHLTNSNKLLYKKPIEPEDIFYYFVQNIKSDFYIMRHSLVKEEKDYYEGSPKKDERFASFSNDNFVDTNKN